MENGELRDGIIFHLFIINGANQINGRVRTPRPTVTFTFTYYPQELSVTTHKRVARHGYVAPA